MQKINDSVPVLSKNIPNTKLKISSNAFKNEINYFCEDSLIYNVKEKRVILYDSANVNYQKTILNAPKIHLDLKENKIVAFSKRDSLGKIIKKSKFQDGKEVFLSDKIIYNTKSKKGIIYNATTKQGEGYVNTEFAKIHKNKEVHLKNAHYTTCPVDENQDYYIHLTKAKVIPNDKIVTGPAYLVIEDVPTPFFIPFGYFPISKNHASGILLPEPGVEQTRGVYLKNTGFFLAINEYIDAQITADVFSKGSWGSAFTSRYKKRYKFGGELNFKYNVNIQENLFNDTYTESTEKSYWFTWRHSQDRKARPNSNFNANVNLGSSKHHSLNSTSSSNYLSNTWSSNVHYDKRWNNKPINFSLDLKHSQNNITSQVDMDLPSASLYVNEIFPFKRKNNKGKQNWIEKLNFKYSANFANKLQTKDSLLLESKTENFRTGFKHRIPFSANYKLLKYFTFNPSLDYQGVLYNNKINKFWNIDSNEVITDTSDFRLYYAHSLQSHFNVNFNMPVFIFYEYNNSKIKAVRQVITAFANFSYIPFFGDKDNPIYYDKVQTDSTGNEETYSIFQNGIYSSPNLQNKYGVVNFGIRNNLEMKVKSKSDSIGYKKIKLIDNFTINSSYNIFADSMNLASINFSARTTILKNITLNLRGSLDPYFTNNNGTRTNDFLINKEQKLAKLSFVNFSTSFYLKPINTKIKMPWNASISYNYYERRNYNSTSITQTMSFSGFLKLTKNWEVRYNSGYDFVAKEFTYTKIDFYRNLHCWEMSLSLIPFGARRNYVFGINVKAKIMKDALKYEKRKDWRDYQDF